jgi:ABA DEFICIENT 4-like
LRDRPAQTGYAAAREGERMTINADLLAEGVYQASRWLARAGWLVIAISLLVPKVRRLGWPTTQFVIPAIFCVGYVLRVWEGRPGFELYGLNTFFFVEGIQHLYTNDSALVASWLHFLALDMFAGTWIVRDGLARGMPKLLILLCLPFTLMLAPSGLLIYFALRVAVRPRPAAG